MNLSHVILAISICYMSAHAASITVSNFSGPDLTAIVDSDGTTLRNSGVIGLGTFAVEPTSVNNVLASFSQVANPFVFNAPNFSANLTTTSPLISGDGFVGSFVYAVIGNGTTLANSTALAVWKATSNTSGNQYVADSPTGGPDLVTILSSKGSLIIGTLLPAFNGPAGVKPAFQLTTVPEPSTLLLSVFGLLGLLRHKR